MRQYGRVLETIVSAGEHVRYEIGDPVKLQVILVIASAVKHRYIS
jgi:hypothetical protein